MQWQLAVEVLSVVLKGALIGFPSLPLPFLEQVNPKLSDKIIFYPADID